MKYKVCVRCATFNHATYITDTMNGFILQKTNFPFVCVIVDDASTDGNQTVIEHYLLENFEKAEENVTPDYRQLVARSMENHNCHFVVYLLKENHYSQGKMPLKYAEPWMEESEYVAMCEGDDYWIDEHKLQKQADALDANPQAVMVYTNFLVIDGEGNPISRPIIEKFPGCSHSGDNLPTLLRYGNYIMTLTTMYRYKVWESESYANRPVKLDFALTMSAALMGDFIWLPKQTACYHSLQSGMIMSNHPWVKQVTNDIYCYYAGLVMNGKCKPLSLGQRIYLITLILMRALARKDSQFKKDIMKVSLLARLLLPVAYVRLKCERLKDRIKR